MPRQWRGRRSASCRPSASLSLEARGPAASGAGIFGGESGAGVALPWDRCVRERPAMCGQARPRGGGDWHTNAHFLADARLSVNRRSVMRLRATAHPGPVGDRLFDRAPGSRARRRTSRQVAPSAAAGVVRPTPGTRPRTARRARGGCRRARGRCCPREAKQPRARRKSPADRAHRFRQQRQDPRDRELERGGERLAEKASASAPTSNGVAPTSGAPWGRRPRCT